jgi:VWFA-related protein
MYWSQGEGYYGYGPAKRISDETGGRLIDVGNNGAKLKAAFQQIQDELRTQYVASYTSSNAKADGTFRKVTVDCHSDTDQNLKVQVRKGYYAPSPGN